MLSEDGRSNIFFACAAKSGSVSGKAEKMYRRNSSQTLWAK
jgi:hypothetical protein